MLPSAPSEDPLQAVARRLERIEARLAALDAPKAAAIAGLAATIDTLDGWAARWPQGTGDLDARKTAILAALEALTAPKVLSALTQPEVLVALTEMAAVLPILSRLATGLAASAPLAAAVVDVFDAAAARLVDAGIDMERLKGRLGMMTFSAVQVLSRRDPEMDRALAALPAVLRLLAALATQAADAGEAPEGAEPPRRGLLALLRVSREPQVQRTLDWSIRLARGMGAWLHGAGDRALSRITPRD